MGSGCLSIDYQLSMPNLHYSATNKLMVNPELLLAFATRDDVPGAIEEPAGAVIAAILRSFEGIS